MDKPKRRCTNELYKITCPHCWAVHDTEKTEPQKNGIAHSYAWCLKCKGAIIITYNKEEDSMDANKWKLRNGE